MIIVTILLALALPAAIGWCAVSLCDARTPVLQRSERLGWSLIIGPTLSMLLACIATVSGVTSFTLGGFLSVMLPVFAVLTAMCWRAGCLMPRSITMPSIQTPRDWKRIGMTLVILWAVLKVLMGAYDLLHVPTYWDDSFNNWNMRGKMFYVTHELTLEIPVGNGTVQTAQGVSSYPPALPLMKTWAATVYGSWSEPVVNGAQLVWTLGLLLLFYGTLRRKLGVQHSLFGAALLVSLPHMLIQMTNPYAEILVAAHLFAALSALLGAATSDASSRKSWLFLFVVALGLLLFTKNEATVIYAPILVLIAIPVFRRSMTLTDLIAPVILASTLTIPWLIFKWTHGLTFGNAKSVSGVEIRFSTLAAKAVWHHLTREPNLLFLPLSLLTALLLSGKEVLQKSRWIPLFFVAGAAGIQVVLFVMIRALETEAVMQTGLSRGFTQIAPVAMLLLILLATDLLRKEAA